MVKDTVSTAIIVFMIVAITSVAVALPVSAQTATAELKNAGAKWPNLRLSIHSHQILYAVIKNTGTEPVYIQVSFHITDLVTGDVYLFSTSIALLQLNPSTIKLEVTLTPALGTYAVQAALWYSADCTTWFPDGGKSFGFNVFP